MKGADELITKIKNLQSIRKEIAEELEATATDVEIGAIRDAPVAIGQKIRKIATNGGLSYQIEVNAGAIGAYVEFGTGASAASLVPTLPDDWQAIAKRFYINGQGRLIAAPYLYPNWLRFTNGLDKRIVKILEKAIK